MNLLVIMLILAGTAIGGAVTLGHTSDHSLAKDLLTLAIIVAALLGYGIKVEESRK